MLQEISIYENLGTPRYFFELLAIIKESKNNWTEREIDSFFYNKSIDGRSVFDGCLSFGILISVFAKDENGRIGIGKEVANFVLLPNELKSKICELILQAVGADPDFHDIFSPQNISFDVKYHTIQINNNAFKFKYSCFKQLLIDFDILRIHPIKEIKKYIFNLQYKKSLDKSVLPELKKKRISLEELRRQLEQNQIYGEEAELFCLSFERKRLSNKNGIEWVAEYSVAEGYDVLSFNSAESNRNDRHIEVKSFSGRPNFFWSRNEIDIARIKGDEYFLYLVNRLNIGEEGYCPIIIQNPFKNVSNSIEWKKTAETYKVENTSPDIMGFLLVNGQD